MVEARYTQDGDYVDAVRITNVASYPPCRGRERSSARASASSTFDVAYGGNFYAILEPQKNYRDMADCSAGDLLRLSPDRAPPAERQDRVRASGEPDHPRRQPHPVDRRGRRTRRPHARNAVFYGDKAIDRSPCGTGTSARMAQLAAKGKLKVGDDFVHESIIGSAVQRAASKRRPASASHDAIIPSIEGWARDHRLQHHLHRRPRSVQATGFR